MNVLEEANETVGQRAEEYGPPTENFAVIAGMWSAYLGTPVSPYDYSQMMVLAKVGRAKTGSYKPDNHVDQAEYSLTSDMIAKDTRGCGCDSDE